jgi:hypothetical protein
MNMLDYTAARMAVDRFVAAAHELMQLSGGQDSETAVGAIAYALGRVFADIEGMEPKRLVEIGGQLSAGLGVAALAHQSLPKKGLRAQ